MQSASEPIWSTVVEEGAPPTPSNPAEAVGSRYSIPARLRSFGYAGQGLVYLLRREPNARIHFAATVAVLGFGFMLRITAADWRWILLAIGLVWSAEAINTSLERLCDLVHPGPHETVKMVKDVAAGAVLVCALAAAAIGLITIWPYLATFVAP